MGFINTKIIFIDSKELEIKKIDSDYFEGERDCLNATAAPHRRSQRHGYRGLGLETGSMDDFIPARKMYEKFGFVECGPFADDTEDPNSVSLSLNPA